MIEDDADKYSSCEDFPGNLSKRFFSTFVADYNTKVEDITYVPPNPTPDLHANFKERMQGLNCSDLVLVIQKPLFATDVSKNHYRLSMPLNQIKNQFLSRNENDALINQNGDGVPVMEVFLIEPSCQKETKMNPKIWPMQKGQKRNAKVSYMYSLGKHWNEVVSGTVSRKE
ncbi:B3 domain-containing protein [Actinidia chinensis var. chinensis]|uniref:B3 domain-containing protein n=1 Tax=Actinidia chinensis var. chinensis TaxID=1590841 RepID=A0A2R6QZF0_ACTCC|nr:B3 domain-containing protein [Actinidia chinensis var. chinensis]